MKLGVLYGTFNFETQSVDLLPLLLALAFFASCARVAAIKLSWANSCTRRNHGVLLSVLSWERKSLPESSASS